MSDTTPALCWFEIPTADFDRAKAFYEALLGSPIERMEMGPVTMGFLPPVDGATTGAIVHADENKPSAEGVTVYFSGGDDLTEVLNRVEPAGGTVVVPKTEIGEGFGFFALFMDTEGNRVGLHSNT